MKNKFTAFSKTPLMYGILIAFVLTIFLTLAFTSAHRLPSRVDEGSFLIKGYYYITGKYTPFEDYGPWTNNMPFAYYIPGLAQAIFGPGLRTGRYFAIFLTLLNLVGVWILTNRLKGKWWALFGVFILAINPAVIRIYVQAISEGLVACLLTWALVFLIGKNRQLWQIALGAFLCALTTLTRQNMIFLLPFAVLYAFWVHGRKAGWVALVFTALPFIGIHIIYYPQIMNLWYAWLPGVVKKTLGIVIINGGGEQAWQPVVSDLSRVVSFFMAFRYHFAILFGVFLASVMLWVRKWWANDSERKTVILLTGLFFVFFWMHAWASLTKNYCVFCFPNYITFFLPIGLLISVIVYSNLLKMKPQIPIFPVILFTLSIIPGLFLGSLETTGHWVMALPFPRLKGGQILTGYVPLWSIFSNRFNLEFHQLLPMIAPAFGFLIALVFILVALILHKKTEKQVNWKFSITLSFLLLAASTVLTPTYLMGNELSENLCGGDVIASYETVGAELAKTIPEGAKVFWGAGSVVTPLLYIPNAELHSPQLNGVYSLRRGGERDLLEKMGYYNEESTQAWRDTDEFFLINYLKMGEFWKAFFTPEKFNEYERTSPFDPCDAESTIRIYRRK